MTTTVARPITARQGILLDFIRTYTARHGFGPTVAEMSKHLGVSNRNGTMMKLRTLQAHGLVTGVGDGVSRSVRPTGLEVVIPEIPCRPDLPELTPAQAEVLRFGAQYQAEHGEPPTGRQYADWLGYRSLGAVWKHLDKLAAKGYVDGVGDGDHRSRRILATRD